MHLLDPEALEQDLVAWRHALHAHPEFGFETELRPIARQRLALG